MEDEKVTSFNEEQTQGASWNLAQAIVFEIGQLLASASGYFVRENMVKAYHSLKSVKLRIVQYLDSKERLVFLEQEQKVENLLYRSEQLGHKYNEYENRIVLKEYSRYRKAFMQEYEIYNSMIMDSLRKAGLDIPNKSDEGMF